MNEELFEKLLKNIQNKYLKGEINLDELMEESINLGNIKNVLSNEKSKESLFKTLGELYLREVFTNEIDK